VVCAQMNGPRLAVEMFVGTILEFVGQTLEFANVPQGSEGHALVAGICLC
jgi:hypothetical protein